MKKHFPVNSDVVSMSYTNFMEKELSKCLPLESLDLDKFSEDCSKKWQGMPLNERILYKNIESNLLKEDCTKNSQKKLMNEKYLFTNDETKSVSVKQKLKVKRKKAGAPKRPMSSYFYYAMDFRNKVRNQHPDWSLSQISAELAKLWEICTNRDHYINLAQQDRERYNKEFQQFQAGYVFDNKSGKVINNLSVHENLSESFQNTSLLSYDTEFDKEDSNMEFLVA